MKTLVATSLRKLLSPFPSSVPSAPLDEICTYEAQHFIKLAARCNPTVLEVLWSNDIRQLHPQGAELLSNRNKLLDRKRIYEAFNGYAQQQRKHIRLPAENMHRLPKSSVACLRVLQQGVDLLRTGELDPIVHSNRDLILEIKGAFDPERHIPLVLSELDRLQWLLFDTHESTNVEFRQDRDWIEGWVEDTYKAVSLS